MRVWIEGKEINVERYEAFSATLPLCPIVPQVSRMGAYPEIPATPDADMEAWTDELIARIKRDNGLRDGPVCLISVPSLEDDNWIKRHFLKGEEK